MHVILYLLSLVNLLHSMTRWNSLFINSYIIIKSFVVMLTLICWSVDLNLLLVTFTRHKVTLLNKKIVKFVNPNKKVKLVEKMEVFMSYHQIWFLVPEADNISYWYNNAYHIDQIMHRYYHFNIGYQKNNWQHSPKKNSYDISPL